MMSQPQVPLHRLPLLADTERHHLLVESNDTHWVASEALPSLGIHETLRRQSRLTPELVAIDTASGERLTYLQLTRQIHRLSRRLRQVGVGSESVVGFAVPPGPQMVVALFAILEAGGAYLPLDLDQPKDRLAFVLHDAGAGWLLGCHDDISKLQGPATQAAAQVLVLEEEVTHSERLSPEPLGLPCHPEQLAYVIYTSGTSGEPKGVQIPHRALLDFLHKAEEIYSLQPGDRILQFAALPFDTSAEEIYPCLASGATLVFGAGPRLKSPGDFGQQAVDLKLTIVDLPTAYWHELMADPGFGLPAALRLVILGGEKARADTLEAWQRRMRTDLRLLNSYGPSEATIVATACDLAGPHGVPAISRSSTSQLIPDPPIGRPLSGCSVVLVDRFLDPVLQGAHGEITLGGPGLARGYLGRPGLTAEKFVPAPLLGTKPGSRLYKTGDRARLRADGNLEFLGRVDHQVKLRGLRIEPGEVASVLGRHKMVDEVEVLARPLATGQLGLVAFAVISKDTRVETTELRSFLQEFLPEYMVPAAFVLLEELPKNASNKIDRQALLGVALSDPAEKVQTAIPKGELETHLAKIWGEVLGLERVGVEDNFFDLGGDSLLILRLHRRLEEELPQKLKVLDLFRHTSVRALAAHLGTGEERPQLERARKLVEQQKKARQRRHRQRRRR